MNYLQDHKLWWVLLLEHPQDSKKSDEHSRWWLYWYKYSTCNHTNQNIFDNRVLIRTNIIPSSAKYIKWALHIKLPITGNHYLLGTFDFIPNTNQIRTKKLIPCYKWKNIETVCLNNNFVPPKLGSIISHEIKSTQQNKTRKQKLA